MDIKKLYDRYNNRGFISNIQIISKKEALLQRQILEETENRIGLLHYKAKVHTILKSVYDLVINSKILDIVELLIGPNILLHNVTYIIKEPNSLSHVSWHQDLTYWGFDKDDQVSVWLAITKADKDSGCMQMIPGSHKWGKLQHVKTFDPTNVLSSGQTVTNIDEKKSIYCDLLPGEASFHHGRILHKSNKNITKDRRIGLNIQYLATHVKQTKHKKDSAICVRGIDKFNNFLRDTPPIKDLDPKDIKKFYELDKTYQKTQKSN